MAAQLKSALEQAKQTCSKLPKAAQDACMTTSSAATKGLTAYFDRISATHKQLAADFLKRCSQVVTDAPQPTGSNGASTKPSDNGAPEGYCSSDRDCKDGARS